MNLLIERQAGPAVFREPSPPVIGSEVRVLLIDEQPEESGRLSDWLDRSRQPHFFVDHADSLESGLDRLEGLGFDVVLVGLHEDRSSGLLALKAARVIAPDIPLVAVSATYSVARDAMHLGASDLLVRGQFTPRALIESLKNALIKASKRRVPAAVHPTPFSFGGAQQLAC